MGKLGKHLPLLLKCCGVDRFFVLAQQAHELMQCFDGQRYALAAADAKRDQAARETVAAHRVDQFSRQHCTGRANRMAMGHRAAFNVDDLFRKPELASNNDGDGCEGFIDLGALRGRAVRAPVQLKEEDG